ncbi:DUF6234 family protein [Streptomyces sp. NPDC049954]|uniref:DUF6234 family protein n=1 Tax=Streptomyces sp. NPDC049954 TaxID=3155779 RepID=UPI00342F8F74
MSDVSSPRPAPQPAPPSAWAQVALAVILGLVELAVVAWAFFADGLSGWAASGSPDPPDHSTLRYTVLGVGGFGALLTALFWWGRERVAAVLQGLLALVLLLVAALSWAQGPGKAPSRAPAPNYRGTYGQCFSGGDSDECPGG